MADANVSFEDAVKEYAVNVGSKRCSYRASKTLLRQLHQDLTRTRLDFLSDSFSTELCDRLGQIVLSHRDLADNETRSLIQEKRRNMWTDEPDWYEVFGRRVDIDENNVTDLIAAIEVIYILIFRARIDFDEFVGLSELKITEVSGLAKLMTVFTGDYKILRIYLSRFRNTKNFESFDQLFQDVFDIAYKSKLSPTEYTQEMIESLNLLIISYMDIGLIEKQIQDSFEFLNQEEFTLSQNLAKYLRPINAVGFVCQNAGEFEEKLQMAENWLRNELSRFWEGLFIFEKIRILMKLGEDSANKINISYTASTIVSNVQNLLIFMLPLIQYCLKEDLNREGGLNHIVKKIRSNERFLQIFRDNDSKNFKNFDYCLKQACK